MTDQAQKSQCVLDIPALAEGEVYIGAIVAAHGTRRHHLILLPGQVERMTWAKAKTWAEQAGGALPDRLELALMYAICNGEFEPDWYWSGEQHAYDADYAWYQHFTNGTQGYSLTIYELRARAVRRSVI